MTTTDRTKLETQSLDLCHAIEGAGASPELTACSVLASELRQKIAALPADDAAAAPTPPPLTTSGAEGAQPAPEARDPQA